MDGYIIHGTVLTAHPEIWKADKYARVRIIAPADTEFGS